MADSGSSGNESDRRRSGQRPRKRKAPENRHVLANRVAKKMKENADVEDEQPPRPSSASERKLEDRDAEVSEERKDWSGLRIIDPDKVFSNILAELGCKKCRGPTTISEVKHCGLSSQYQLTCKKCGVLKIFKNCVGVSSNQRESEANRRLVYASQVLGFRHEGMKKFCALMDLPPPVSFPTYKKTLDTIGSKVIECADQVMKEAIEEEVELSNTTDIAISGDGTWQKRGFSSKNGVVTAVGINSVKSVDVEVMTTVCYGCNSYKGPKHGLEFEEWKEKHMPDCSINHEGSAGMMEVTGMKRIFSRSPQKGVRYAKYIGDGDAKTFSAVVDSKPYGNDLIPKKVECTGHVQKRMGSQLRELKKKMRGTKLSDGKTIGGKGRLTDKRIDSFATYYGNAIRSSDNVKTMKNKIWAIFYHYKSTNAKPEHKFCPTGPDSWCKYNIAVLEKKQKQFKHQGLPTAVMDAIKPVFAKLTKEELLERCVGGHTQNPNESLNNIIWKNVPKTVFCGKQVLDIGVADAVLSFNSGYKGRLRAMKMFGVTPGRFCVDFCNAADWKRITKANTKALAATKEARRSRRQSQKAREEEQQEKEGPSYVPGGF